MEKAYQPDLIESRWRDEWEKHALGQPTGQGDAYTIMLPPPNVTGTLHMGHGFQITLMDILIRYHRMLGQNVLWQSGTDHAGIATQMVVERQLLQQGTNRLELGRDLFLQKVWEWRTQSGQRITQQIRRLGASIDWTRERFTMDEEMCQAVYHAFVTLYREGLIYRGYKLVNWDPVLLTAISDLEVVTEEELGQMWYIRYPLDPQSGQSGFITIATTRPETFFGDVAIAVHPQDPRYQQLIGCKAQVPLQQRSIPIIADESIDPEFGTGCVKITPAHDFHDYEIGKKHNLPMLDIFTPTAQLNEKVPKDYQGLDRFVAREKVIADLNAKGLLEKVAEHRMNVPRGDRSGVVVEPRLTQQWFLSMQTLAQPAIDAGHQGSLKFIPDNWTKTYLQWLTHIQDWCLSRQLWWGHRIPAWYDEAGKIYVGMNEADVRKHYKLENTIVLTQDNDVLDTWFSSALWPFATLGWPQATPDLKTFYPTNVLVTGFDIIFFWVARMVMFGLHFTKQVPFAETYITGLIRDSQGQKMSKSKGNILDPIDLIDGIGLTELLAKRTQGLMQPAMVKKIEAQTRKEFPQGIEAHGTDALRFTFCALANTGRDINFELGRLGGYRNFCNKLWNASRYVLMQINEETTQLLDSTQREYGLAEKWIHQLLNNTLIKIETYFKNYRFDLIAQTIYDFIWKEYCDWYLEFAKCTLSASDSSQAMRAGTIATLVEILETSIKLLHPLMPFITEEIYLRLCHTCNKPAQFLLNTEYPKSNSQAIDLNIMAQIDWLKNIILAIRNVRGENNISPQQLLEVWLSKGTEFDQRNSKEAEFYILQLAKITHMHWQDQQFLEKQLTATALLDTLEIHVPLEGLIDMTVEMTRLKKNIAKLQATFEQTEKRLNDKNYLEKAPAEIVQQEQERLGNIKMQLNQFHAQLNKLLNWQKK